MVVLKTETVKGGQRARWPYDPSYQEPTSSDGRIFVGWSFKGKTYKPPFDNETRNPFGPINSNIEISAVWKNQEEEPDPTQGFWISFYSYDPNECIIRLYPTTVSPYIAGDYQVIVYGNVPDGFDINITYTYRPDRVGEESYIQIASQAGSETLDYGVSDVEGWFRNPDIGGSWVAVVPTSAVVVCNNGVKVYVNFTREEITE